MAIALSAGLSLKPAHYADALASPADARWFEVHPENYCVDGGPRLAWLAAVRERHPLSLHSVSLSLAADAPPDRAELARLAALVARVEPALVSEHLAWSAWRGVYVPDLLPFPRTREALERIAANVSIVQDALKRPIAIENPSHYLALDGHEMDEIAFLAALVARTGCRLLVDVNNIHVNARNHGIDPLAYLAAIPPAAVAEIHLAGHDASGPIVIDTHGAPVAPEVWALYRAAIERFGPVPTLIEWDTDIPAFAVLAREAATAQQVLAARHAQPA